MRNMHLTIHPGNQAELTGEVDVTVLGRQVAVQPRTSLQLGVQDGHVVINVTRVNVNGVNVPQGLVEPRMQGLKQNAEGNLNAQLDNLRTATGLRLVGLSTAQGIVNLQFAP